MKTTTQLPKAFIVMLASSILWGCDKKAELAEVSAESLDQASESLNAMTFNVNKHPLNKTVCDPLGGTGGQHGIEHGIKASLFYRGAGMPRYYSSIDYVNKTVASNQSLFLSDLNVPTRVFSEGFSTQTSGVVKDDSGNKLIEFFGLKFETVLRLSDDQSEGNYELATLADDGIIVKAKIDGVWKSIINNDGDHPTQMGCSIQTLNLKKDSAIPLEITYYQGPRHHIANVLMWRKSDTAGKDVSCKKVGNHLFFNPDQASKPQSEYLNLLSRGWSPISANSFYLPGSENYNPCVEGTNPVISNFRVTEVFSNEAILNWTTDIEATSQILVTDVETGIQILTVSDNLLRTNHSILVRGLTAGKTYSLQAVSISADLGRTLSPVLTITTVE